MQFPTDISQAKFEIKKLKMKKKEMNLKKKEITQKQQQIRANYTDKIRRLTSASGSNAFSKLSRFITKKEKDQLRKDLANELQPIETTKNNIINNIHELDRIILELEKHILHLEKGEI